MIKDPSENIEQRDRPAEVRPEDDPATRNFDTQGPDIETAETTMPQSQVSTEAPADAGTKLAGEDDGTAPLGPSAATGAAPEADQQGDRVAELEQLLGERTTDLQRVQAEYVNYKRRVDRDRMLARQTGVESVVVDLLPVLDSIDLARQHGDSGQGFEMVADALGKLGAKHGLVAFGAVGDVFDPTLHEALMAVPMPDGQAVAESTVSQVMQTGYRLGDRVLRPARVGVANPS